MNITEDGWFEITWYLGYFCVIVARPPVIRQGFDDEEEQEVSQAQPAHRERPISLASLVTSPAFMLGLEGRFA